jgi:hypothetical protein
LSRGSTCTGRRELEAVIGDVLIHVVGKHPDVRVLHQHVGQPLDVGAAVAAAGRVRRRIEDHPLRLCRDRLLERLRRHLEATLHRRPDDDRRRAGERDDLRVAHPVGRRDDHLVAGVERRHQRVEQHLLAASADADFVDRVVDAVLALELLGDRRLELWDAVDRGVFGLALADRADRGFLDVVGGVEIGLAGAEADDVHARGFQRPRLVGHRDGGGRLDAPKRVGKETHGLRGSGWQKSARTVVRRTANLKGVNS